MTKTYTVRLENSSDNFEVQADRFILSAEQGSYIFLRDTDASTKETVAIVSYSRVVGVSLTTGE